MVENVACVESSTFECLTGSPEFIACAFAVSFVGIVKEKIYKAKAGYVLQT